MSKLKILSLFSGIGAFEEALKSLGVCFELVAYCEFDDVVSKAYSLIHNVSKELNLGDINYIDEKQLPDFDLMTYGFPCQSFSVAGKRLGFEDEERGNLFFESMRIAKEKKPKYMIAENVKGLVDHDNGNTLDVILKLLTELGYNNYFRVLNSSNFDVPQSRERVFIVSIRNDVDLKTFEFPVGSLTKKNVSDILDEDDNRKLVKASLKPYMHKKYFVKKYNSSSGVIKLFDGCAEGYFTSSFTGNRIYSIYGLSPTITTKNDAVYFEIGGHLNNRERFALQGFKKDYVDLLVKNNIPNGKIGKMIGNSIVVNVIREILHSLLVAQGELKYVKGKKIILR